METKNNNFYAKQVYDHWDLLKKIASKRFPSRGGTEISTLADEGLSYVFNKLQEDDWTRVRQYRGQGSFEAYLASMSRFLLEDFARQKFGYLRIPELIKRGGPPWIRAYKKLCWERLSATAVIEDLKATFDPSSDPASLWEIVSAIRARDIHCGKISGSQAQQSESDFADATDIKSRMESAVQTPSIEEMAIAEQHVRVLKVIAEWLNPDRTAASAERAEVSALESALRNFVNTLTLTNEECLLLRLIFQEGKDVTKAGKRLGLNQNQVHGRLRRLLARIGSALKAAGLEQIFKDLLKKGDF